MRLTLLLTVALVLGITAAHSQTPDEQELARLLSNDSTREATVARIVERGNDMIPLLLSWAQTPPAHVDAFGLSIGQAEVFGRLRTKAAIPFLVKNISVQRWPSTPNVWMKKPEVVVERLPALAALVQIGPEAARVLMKSDWRRMGTEQRLATIFVVSRVPETAETRSFLTTVLGAANLEAHWAQEGLKLLNARDSTPNPD